MKKQEIRITDDFMIETDLLVIRHVRDWEFWCNCTSFYRSVSAHGCHCGPAATYWSHRVELRDEDNRLVAEAFKSGDFDGMEKVIMYHVYSSEVNVIIMKGNKI